MCIFQFLLLLNWIHTISVSGDQIENLELSRSEVTSSNPYYEEVDNEYEMISSLHYEVEAKVSETEVSPTMKNKLMFTSLITH